MEHEHDMMTVFAIEMICRVLLLLTFVFLTQVSHSLELTRPLASSSRCRNKSVAVTTRPNALIPKEHIAFQHARVFRNNRLNLPVSLSRGGGPDTVRASTPGASDVLSYYLLWSPGVFRKTIVCMLVLLLMRLVISPFQDQLSQLAPLDSKGPVGFVTKTVMLPLLSSACCGIQLAINALVGAGGCAGFNKVLGPLRPYFLAVLILVTLSSFPVHQTRAALVKWLQYSLLRWTMALMPEMVHLWNINVGERVRRRSLGSQNGEGNVSTTFEMKIPSMGCVACINKIDSSIRQCAPKQIVEAKSWLEPSGKSGRALVKGVASTRQDAQDLAESVVNAVRRAGFESCSIDSIHIKVKSEMD